MEMYFVRSKSMLAVSTLQLRCWHLFLFLFGILHGVVPQSAKAWRRAAPRRASARERATQCAGTRGASGRWPGSTHGCYAHAVGTCAASSARCPQADCLESQDLKSEVAKDACEELTSGPHGPKDYKKKARGNKPGHSALSPSADCLGDRLACLAISVSRGAPTGPALLTCE